MMNVWHELCDQTCTMLHDCSSVAFAAVLLLLLPLKPVTVVGDVFRYFI